MGSLPEDAGAGPCAFGVLAGFRREFHACLTARRDQGFELADAVLCAGGPVRSLAGLSLAPEHRRGHGALHGAVNHGRIEIARLRRSLAALPLPRAVDGQLMLAVDVSNWLRPGAAGQQPGHASRSTRRTAPRSGSGQRWPEDRSSVFSLACPAERTRSGSIGGNHAELFHLREDVDDAPGLGDSPVGEADDEDLVVGDGFDGWREAHVFTLVGPGNRVPGDDLSPSAIRSSIVRWRSGRPRRSIAHTCLAACAPVASIGNGVRISTSGATTSSIVLEMSSASPVLTASWMRLNVALLLVSWAVDIWSLLGVM